MLVGCGLEVVQIQGTETLMPDGISRWPRLPINIILTALSLLFQWHEVHEGPIVAAVWLGILQSYCHRLELLHRLTQLIPRLGR